MNSKRHLMHAVSTRMAFLGACTLILLALGSSRAHAQIMSSDYLCLQGGHEQNYVMNINGDYFGLHFYPASSRASSYMEDTDGGQYLIYFSSAHSKIDPQPRNQQDVVEGQTGPGYIGTNWDYRHRIVFWSNHPNYQRFDGYIMTQTKDAFAGITWRKDGVPVGFSAVWHHCE